MRKTISILLTFIFFAVSCALPNNNINSQTKDNLKSEIKGKAYFYKDSKTKDYIKPLMTFKTSDEECQGGVLTSMAVLSGIPSNCNDKIDFYIKGQLANTIIAEQAGNYSTSFCLDCGVYDFEIRTTIIDNGSGLCNSSLKNQTYILPGGYHTEHIPCDRPEEDEEPECEGESSIIEPSALKSTFNIKAYSSSDIQSSVEEYLSKVDEVNMLQSQYDNLDNRGLNSKRDEIYTKLQNSITQRNSIKTELITVLNNYKNSLRSKVNSVLNEQYSEDSTYVPTDLQDYKDYIGELNDQFLFFVSSENTYSLLDSINELANEIHVFTQLLNDYTNNNLSNVSPISGTELGELTTPIQVIKYFSKQITNHKIKFDTELIKLDEEIKKLKLEIKYLESIETVTSYNLQNGFTIQSNKNNNFSIKNIDYATAQKAANLIKSLPVPIYLKALGLAALSASILHNQNIPGETQEEAEARQEKAIDDTNKIKEKATKEKAKRDKKFSKKCKKGEDGHHIINLDHSRMKELYNLIDNLKEAGCDFNIDDFDDNGLCMSEEAHKLTLPFDYVDSVKDYVTNAINQGNNNSEKCNNLKQSII